MSLAEDRKTMIAALQQLVVPRLRVLGFKGSIPHFRRLHKDRTDLLMFQFDRHGGGFIVELGTYPPGDFVTSWGKIIPAKELEVSYLHPEQRYRLGSASKEGDHWFRYDQGWRWKRANIFTDLAFEVVQKIEEQAIPWWQAAPRRARPTLGSE